MFHAPTDVVLSDVNVLEPDLIYISEDQRKGLGKMNIQVPPVLVIEVLSDPRIDKVRKRDVYARFEVPEYWVVDPDADRVEIYRPQGDGVYARPEIFEPGDVIATPALPDLTIDLAHLFRD